MAGGAGEIRGTRVGERGKMIGILGRRSSSAEGFKKTRDLVSGLLGAKNAGVTFDCYT
jgi:hypothetical protein